MGLVHAGLKALASLRMEKAYKVRHAYVICYICYICYYVVMLLCFMLHNCICICIYCIIHIH